MSFDFRVSLLLLALNLTLLNPASAQSPQTSPVRNIIKSSPFTSAQGSSQSADEETIRALTEKYGLSISGCDIETIRQFWNPKSSNLASRLGSYQGFFS